MSGKMEDLKGKVKEAVGDVTDNNDMKRDGQADQAVGAVKDKAEKVKNWVEDKVDDAKDKIIK